MIVSISWVVRVMFSVVSKDALMVSDRFKCSSRIMIARKGFLGCKPTCSTTGLQGHEANRRLVCCL